MKSKDKINYFLLKMEDLSKDNESLAFNNPREPRALMGLQSWLLRSGVISKRKFIVKERSSLTTFNLFSFPY